MKYANVNFSSEEEAKHFVESAENEYIADVKAAYEMSLGSGRIITLCGPTCSGKTTTARILDDEFKKAGKELHVVSIDDFFYDKEELVEISEKSGIELDYDSPATIDVELFGKVIGDIEKGGKVLLPKYDFTTDKRIGMEEIFVRDEDVFLFEGIQAVYPDVVKHLAGHNFISLFISVEEPLCCNGVEFSPRELRLMRRIVRDERTRATSAEETFWFWRGVVANEDKHIYPNLGGVDFSINSTMAYEASVIKPFVLPLLKNIADDSEYKDEADALIEKLEKIPEIDSRYVPDESVYREFIGERK